MKNPKVRFWLPLILLSILFPLSVHLMDKTASEESKSLAAEVYIYGYPLVLMDVTKQVMTHVPRVPPDGKMAPINQFGNIWTFPEPSDTSVVSPNADTLYSSAWLDLSKGPMVLSLPDTQGRYYLMPMLDAWTNVFASPGARTTGTGPGDFAVVGPHWKGNLPPGLKEIKAPTEMVWIIGRTETAGPADFPAVNALQKQYKLTPLGFWGKSYIPPDNVPMNPQVDLKTPPVDQVANMGAVDFFEKLASLLKDNPPAAADEPMVEKMKRLGIEAERPFKPDSSIVEALEAGAELGRQKIIEAARQPEDLVNGWKILLGLGQYGTRYLERALIAMVGLGANLSADAVYPMTLVDGQAQPLNGAHRYLLHFEKGQIPPVKGFWSLTMYNERHFFVPNPLKRYAIGDRDKLKKNADGSIDLYIQHENPGAEHESNWLPAPKDNFNLILRLYWPEPAVLDGTWKAPALQRI